jgi:oligopeptide/dipeptide ABC transporter ATP-binding protein
LVRGELTGASLPGTSAPGKSSLLAASSATPLLAVDNLSVRFPSSGDDGPAGDTTVVAGISYDIAAGRTLGVVGESGCGKSMTALALLGLVPAPGRVAGSVRFEGAELLGQSEAAWERVRGARIAMIFQEPMSALNPVITIGEQIAEALELHDGLSRKAALERAVALLAEVGIPSPRERAGAYPHQLSGGMRQRGMIAMALACRPALLIVEEPTTALDVTIQAQILELMAELQDRSFMAIQLISHNLGVVSEIADDIIVMYAGRIVERAAASELFANPRHPYTIGLIETLPSIEHRVARLPVIKGSVPDPARMVAPGCRFAARCPRVIPACREAEPPLVALAPGHLAACIRAAA